MFLSATTLKLLMDKGITGRDLLDVYAALEADWRAVQPVSVIKAADETAEKRRAYDRERKRKKGNSTGISTGVPVEQSSNTSTGIPPEFPPETAALARVRDKTSNSEIPGGTVVDVSASALDQPDDWPQGNPVEALVSEVGSPRLDPSKSPGLVTTAGRLAAWRREGASWRHDVVPVVTVACGKAKTPIGTWKYFDQAIANSIAENRRALEIPDAAEMPRGQGPPLSLTDRMSADNAEARRRAFELLDQRAAKNG